MDDEKKKNLKQRERAIDFIYYAAAVSAGMAIILYIVNFNSRPFSDNPEDWGVFGDFIGGTLNPIFAFFSFVLLLLNLTLQRQQLDKTEEQLELNREELKLTREELKKAADAQIDSAKVMNEQLKTQTLQQFDSLYVLMINQIEHFYKNLDANKLEKQLQQFRSLDVEQAVLFNDQNFCRYQSYLILILKNINSANIDLENKQRYINLIIASIPNKFLMTLYLSFIHIDDLNDLELIEILKDYDFFKSLNFIRYQPNLKFDIMYLIGFYGEDLFKKNSDYHKISDSWTYHEIKEISGYQNFWKWSNELISKYSLYISNDKKIKLIFNHEESPRLFLEEKEIAVIKINSRSFNKDRIQFLGENTELQIKINLQIEKDQSNVALTITPSLKNYYLLDVLNTESILEGVSVSP